MRKTSRIVVLLLFVLLSQSLHAQSLSSIIEEAPNQEALWSVTVRSESGAIQESYHPDKVIIPASNQKLITTAAVLDGLGSEFQYETVIYGRGEQVDSLWKGDVIIKGAGDPSISGYLYDDNRYHVFEELLEQLRKKGIKAISGDLIADLSYFDEDYYPKGWDWYDLSFYYGVQVSPLSFNNNAVDLEVFADGDIGETPRIRWFPDSTDYVEFKNQQVITHAGLEYDEYYRRSLGSNTIVLGSGLPKGYYETESLSINNPPLFFLDSFSKFLNNNGISFRGEFELTTEPVADIRLLQILAIHLSKPLSELVAWTNKESDNLYAEMLLKTLSAEKGKKPGSFEHGIKLVRTFLAEVGIDTTYVRMNDGSGMASGNFNKTSIISKLLQNMLDQPAAEAYLGSMSVAGIDGTIAHRMKGTPMYNNFKGKSGFVTGVRTLSGYLEAKSGQKLIVSIATNNYISEKVRPIDAVHEQILEYLYEKY